MPVLDRIDEKILVLLQANNQLTYAQIADKVSVSASSCRRRIQALRRTGVIVADISVVNPEAAGYRFTVVSLVTLERDTPDVHAAFRKAISDLAQVVQCHFVAGTYDYVVQFRLSTMEEYDPLLDRYFTSNPHVKRVESMVVLKEVKSFLSPSSEPARR